MTHALPQLPYSYEALEPHIDSQTMQIHHTKHHQTYIDKLNAALTNAPDLAGLEVEDLLRKFNEVPPDIQTAVRNHGGGHANHSLFWKILSANFDQLPEGDLATSIQTAFASFGDFQTKFAEAALNHFGSGWTWLVVNNDKNLMIVTTPNQDSPILNNQTPILGLDIWEHAYYLKYQSKRVDYISAFWHIVNWDVVQHLYTQAITSTSEPESAHH